MLNPFKPLERKLEMNLIEHVIASLVERVFHNYVTTVIGVLVVLAATLGGMAQSIADGLMIYGIHVHAALVTAAAVALGVACILAKDSGVKLPTQVGMILLALAVVLGGTAPASAQSAISPLPNAPAAPVGFTASTGPVAINYRGAWSVGTIVDQSFDLMDFGAKKTNHLIIAGSELLAPTPGWNAYLGKVTLAPDFSKVLARTNIAPNSLSVSFDAAAGVATPTSSGSNIAWYAGGGLKYQLTSALSWQSLQAQYGAIGSQRFAALSTGLSFLFGK